MSPTSSSKGVEVYILQEEISEDISTEIKVLRKKAEYPVPRTVAVLVEKYDWIKRYPVEHLVGQTDPEVTEILHVPDEVVRRWGLREGDKVRFNPKEGFKEIYDVNGFTDSEAVKQRPVLIGGLRAQYAERRIPIESVQLEKPMREGEPDGNKSNRAFTILSPFPDGGRVIIASPAGAGKSTQLRFVYKALLRWMKDDKKLFVIALQVGERPEDATELEKIRDSVDHDESRSEIFLAPAGDPKKEPREGHYWLTKFVKARAERLCEGTREFGYRVVLLIDSLSRVQMSHSFAEKIEKPRNVGLLSQGLSIASLTAALDILQVAGNFGDRSLTIVPTMLKDELNPKKRKRSAEHVLFEQSGPSISTAIWGLVSSSDDKLKPNIDIEITTTREFYRLCTSGQFKEREHVLSLMQTSAYSSDGSFRPGAANAVRNLLKYAEDYPTFESSQFADYDKIPEKELSTEKVRQAS